MRDYEYELDKSTGDIVKKYMDMINNDGFKKVIKMWNYRIVKRNSVHEPECYYALSEVFYTEEGKLMAYSEKDEIVGGSPEEIIAVLEMMLADAKKDAPVLTEDDFKA